MIKKLFHEIFGNGFKNEKPPHNLEVNFLAVVLQKLAQKILEIFLQNVSWICKETCSLSLQLSDKETPPPMFFVSAE